MEEEARKNRSAKARLVTRRVNEILNAVRNNVGEHDLEEKIHNLKYAVEELGKTQDDLIGSIDETDDEKLQVETKWYDEYDKKANLAIKGARKYLEIIEETQKKVKLPIKLKKLEIPKFNSQPKDFFKWKEKFERFTVDLDEDSKYDYLFDSTTGMAHHYVANKSSYSESMEKLVEIYGNVHMILGILIKEIKVLPFVKKGDFKAFEQLTFKVNDFSDRLNLMGLKSEAENSYILKEIEAKLNTEDTQKWLESVERNVDTRKVEDLLAWLETQTKLRRIATKQSSSYVRRDINMDNFTYTKGGRSNNMNVASNVNCVICNGDEHEVRACPKFMSSTVDEKWNIVKRFRLCFQCLGGDHQRGDCTAPKCQYCSRPHDSTLHNSFQQKRQGEFIPKDTYGHNSTVTALRTTEIPTVSISNGKQIPPRCFLPIVRTIVKNNDIKRSAITMLDSGSELNVINTKLCNKLGLTGTPITINIVGIAGKVLQRHSKVVDLIVEDRMGLQTTILCIVLDKTCGNALKVNKEIFTLFQGIKVPENELVLCGGEVELLIGMNCPRLHQQLSMYGTQKNLMIMETRFEPSIIGRAPEKFTGNYECGIIYLNAISLTQEEDNLWKIAEAETAGIKVECGCEKKSDEEILFENCMKEAWSFDEEGRFQVKLPWKMDPENLKNNKHQVLKRSEALERRLEKNPEVLKLFKVV